MNKKEAEKNFIMRAVSLIRAIDILNNDYETFDKIESFKIISDNKNKLLSEINNSNLNKSKKLELIKLLLTLMGKKSMSSPYSFLVKKNTDKKVDFHDPLIKIDDYI